jgi:hypothetical protein
LALRVGPRGLFGELVAAYVGLLLNLSGIGGGLAVGLLLLCWRERVVGLLAACFPSALNNQLRTGADKGNPTV